MNAEREVLSTCFIPEGPGSCQHFVNLYLQVKLSCFQREVVWGRGGGLPYKPLHEVEWLASRLDRFTPECPRCPTKKSFGEPHSRPGRFGEQYIYTYIYIFGPGRFGEQYIYIYIYIFGGGGAGCCTIPECISIRHAV